MNRELFELLSRRQVLGRALALAAAPIVLAPAPAQAATATVSLTDGTLQAFADTMLPGRKASKTDLGNPIHPLAIAGVDPLPGAVETDALALYHHPEIGFDDVQAAFLGELETRSLPHGGTFLTLGYDARVQVCLGGFDFSNPTLLVWEAAAAVPFTAFCAAALIRNATWNDASGYRVMGLPGTAPNGYRGYSWGRKLSHERTKKGYLP